MQKESMEDDVHKGTDNKTLKSLKRIEKRLEFYFKECNIEEKYQKLVLKEDNEPYKKRCEMAEKNSKNSDLVLFAKNYYKDYNKPIPKDRLVLYFYNRKPFWIFI